MRELPLYTICQLIVTENRCFDTAERIQIMKMNISKRDLNNNNLKSTCYYKYLIRLLLKKTYDLIVLIYSLPHACEVTRNLAR